MKGLGGFLYYLYKKLSNLSQADYQAILFILLGLVIFSIVILTLYFFGGLLKGLFNKLFKKELFNNDDVFLVSIVVLLFSLIFIGLFSIK